MSGRSIRGSAAVFVSTVGLSFLLSAATGCGGSKDDQKFAAASFDENTEPLTDAIIGSPSGVTTVGSPPEMGGVASSGSSSSGSSSGMPSASGSSSSGSISIGPADAGFDNEGGIDGGSAGGFGMWHFDDCSPTSNFLIDSSGEGANAQHALKGSCVPGISGLGVQIRNAKDVVQVPDEPQFTVTTRIALSAWVKPNTVTGDQPIIIKRLNNKTAFSLGIHGGNIQMSVVLESGTTVISQAPIEAGTWTNVAGMFDGTFVFLFINGQQFGQVYGAGTVRDVFAPLRIGATTQSQFFDGIIDEVFVSTQNVTASQLEAFACISKPSTLDVQPPVSPPVPFDTNFHYNIAVTDNDVGFCQPKQYELNIGGFGFGSTDPGISETANPGFVSNVQPGATANLGADVSANDEANFGVHTLSFDVFDFGPGFGGSFEELQGQLVFNVAQPTGCFVDVPRELMILDTSVVDDPVRTFGVSSPGTDGGVGFPEDASIGGFSDGGGSTGFGGGGGFTSGSTVSTAAMDLLPAFADAEPSPADVSVGDAGQNPSLGVWSFGHLMREMAPTPDQAPAMTEQLFDHWLTDQSVNGFTVSARPAIQQVLLGIWPRTSDGQLDLDQAPLTLQAIVNRVDLRNLSAGSAGEGRFVFAVNGFDGFPDQFTVILEFNLPAKTQQDVANWASAWHALSSHPFPSEEYNAALEVITRRFADRGAQPGAVNSSALASLRTNEIVLSTNGQWELREFVLSPTTGFLQETTVKETPDLSFNGSQTFADFVNQNASAIIAEVPGATGIVPAQFEGSPFLAGSVFNNLVEWSAPGITNDDARFHASMNTCNGCHGPEVNTTFLQITPRNPGSQATLSPFLLGTTVTDNAGVTRTVNDLDRRRLDLTSLVCPSDGGSPPPTDAGPPPIIDAGPPPVLDAGPPVFFADAGGPIMVGSGGGKASTR